uniref:Cadherin domain-containing protein n=1 Tax=Naja naja TaxID=35670 RepID=A0A8C6VK21_NAJNA
MILIRVPMLRLIIPSIRLQIQSSTEVAFPENNSPNDLVVEVSATDADSGSNAKLVYSLAGESLSKDTFSIDAESGEIHVKNVLDREQQERYEFLVVATDKGSPSRKGTASIAISVMDRNDNDPKFMLSGYNFSVMENMPPLSPVGMVTVIDADKGDNAVIQLSVEQDNGDFVIQNGTGTILSSISFDRERQSTYTFRLKAVDGGDPPRSAYVGVTINVLDENDNAPVIIFPSNASYKHILPNTSPGQQVMSLPHRRVTFSAANQAQDLQDPSQHSYYDSGLEESETPSSKSSSGPRIGPLALPEDHYERTTPDGSIGEMEHPENAANRNYA